MKILVTGGAGFIGSHIVDALIEQGHSVAVIDNLSSGSKENLNPKAVFYERDVTSELGDIFQKESPEAVFHLAAQIDVRKSVENPRWDAEVNIIGALNLLEAMRKNNCKRIIFSSTGGALYGETNVIPTPETHETFPESPYGIAKRSIEYYLWFYKNVYELSPCVLRYGNVYGPRQALKGEAGVVAIFIRKMLAGSQCTIFGAGEQKRDYVYVGDVVSANLAALNNNLEDTYNIGTSKETSVNELYEKLASLLDFKEPAMHAPAIPGELQRSCLSVEKYSAHWKPTVDVDEGFAKTVEWFKNH